MTKIINFPHQPRPHETEPVKVVACRHCRQAFFHLIVLEDDEMAIECAMCGREVDEDDPPQGEGWA